jgi:hypothetical protein
MATGLTGGLPEVHGHIHQTMQKVEGNVTFQTAASTAFPTSGAGQSQFSRTDEGASRAVEGRPGNHRCELHTREARFGGSGFFARVSETQPNSENNSNLKQIGKGEEA